MFAFVFREYDWVSVVGWCAGEMGFVMVGGMWWSIVGGLLGVVLVLRRRERCKMV